MSITVIETTRPYGAENNDINRIQLETLVRHCNKIGDPVRKAEIYVYGVKVLTLSGREFLMNISDQHTAFRNAAKFIYMKEEVNGKQVRIPKENW